MAGLDVLLAGRRRQASLEPRVAFMSEGSSLTDAVKLTAGVSLTRAVKDAAGCRIRFIEEVLDTRDDGSQTAAASGSGLPFACAPGLLHFALLVTLFVGSVSTSTVSDAQRGSFPGRGARRVALVIGNSGIPAHDGPREPEERCRRHGCSPEETRLRRR